MLKTYQRMRKKTRENFLNFKMSRGRIERRKCTRESEMCAKVPSAEECAVHSPYQYNSSCIGQGINGCCILFLILSFAFLFSCLHFFLSRSLFRKCFLIILLPSKLTLRSTQRDKKWNSFRKISYKMFWISRMKNNKSHLFSSIHNLKKSEAERYNAAIISVFPLVMKNIMCMKTCHRRFPYVETWHSSNFQHLVK